MNPQEAETYFKQVPNPVTDWKQICDMYGTVYGFFLLEIFVSGWYSRT